jgi:D-alanyl-D-alanine carboxypeptidase/D-alanyl-D-alanine-endopeptidase (penicillin-binding protein 4)
MPIYFSLLNKLLIWGLIFLSSNQLVLAEQVISKSASPSGPGWTKFSQLEKAGFILQDEAQNIRHSKNHLQTYVPASTTKLITALLAIEHWGLDHHFYTDFYLIPSENGPVLAVKGYGDPFLVSEELIVVAEQLKKKLTGLGISNLAGLQLDTSYYQAGLIMPGTNASSNPYDAIPSAIAANFNTINVRKTGAGVASAEKQTPIVDSGKSFIESSRAYRALKSGKKLRVNLGSDPAFSQRYFAELLAHFIQQQGVEVEDNIVWSKVENGKKLYRHHNSRDLADIIKPMMKYSTNFIANQLALNLAVEVVGGQANKHKVQQAYQKLLSERFDWQAFYIEDGAGLSRNNRLSPNQLIDVLQAFKPYSNLLPEIEQRVFAKSGSLIGVSTLAGYLKKDQELWPFAMMINQKVPYRFRNKLARELSQAY